MAKLDLFLKGINGTRSNLKGDFYNVASALREVQTSVNLLYDGEGGAAIRNGRSIGEADPVTDPSSEFSPGGTFTPDPSNSRHFYIKVGDTSTPLTGNMTIALDPSLSWPSGSQVIVIKGDTTDFTVTVSGFDVDGLGTDVLTRYRDSVTALWQNTDGDSGLGSNGEKFERGPQTRRNPAAEDVSSDPATTGITSATDVELALTTLKSITDDIIAGGVTPGSTTGLPRSLVADGTGAGNVYALEDSNREIVDVSSSLRQTSIWAYDAANPVIYEVDNLSTTGGTWSIGVRDDMPNAVTLRPKAVEVAVTGDFSNTSDTVEITAGYSSLRVGQTLSSFPGEENLITGGAEIIALLTSPNRVQFDASASGTDTGVEFVVSDAGLINNQEPPLTLAPGEAYYVAKAVGTIAGVTLIAAGNFQGGTSIIRNNLLGIPDDSTDERRRISTFSIVSEHVEIATPTTAGKEHAGVTIWSDGDDVTINAGVFQAGEWIGLKFIGTTAPSFVAGTNVTFAGSPTGYDPEPAAAGRRIVARNTGELSGSDEIWEIDGFMAETA